MMADSTYARRDWFRHNAGRFVEKLDADSLPLFEHNAHCEVVVSTNPSFSGTFTITAVPTNTTADASAIGVFVDGVLNQTVLFDVGAGFNKRQSIAVNVGVSGAHTIRIQEGERVGGVTIIRLVIDGTVVRAPSVARQYVVIGDSVSMGAFAVPRSVGWANLMRNSSRFDSVVLTGQSGLSMNVAAAIAANRATTVARAMSTCAAYIGSIENTYALCLSINDYVSSPDSTTAAAFQTTLGLLADDLKAQANAQALPGFKIMIHGMSHIAGGLPGAPNDKGSTPADFIAAAQAVAAARPTFCTYVDLFSVMVDADLQDGFVHPNNTGHGKIYNAVLAAT